MPRLQTGSPRFKQEGYRTSPGPQCGLYPSKGSAKLTGLLWERVWGLEQVDTASQSPAVKPRKTDRDGTLAAFALTVIIRRRPGFAPTLTCLVSKPHENQQEFFPVHWALYRTDL